jgi:hypothetical protein
MRVRDEEFILEEGGGLTFNALEPHQYAPLEPLGADDLPLLLLIVVALPQKRESARSKRKKATSDSDRD